MKKIRRSVGALKGPKYRLGDRQTHPSLQSLYLLYRMLSQILRLEGQQVQVRHHAVRYHADLCPTTPLHDPVGLACDRGGFALLREHIEPIP